MKTKTDKIRALLEKGMAVAKVAEKVGVSKAYVYNIQWKDKQKVPEKKSKKVPGKKRASRQARMNAELQRLETAYGELKFQLEERDGFIRTLEKQVAEFRKPFNLREFLDTYGVSFTEGRIVELLLAHADSVVDPTDDYVRLTTAKAYMDDLVERTEAPSKDVSH